MGIKELREQVLLALYFGDELPTKRNDVIAPLVQNGLVRITEYTPTGSYRNCELTDTGKVFVEVVFTEVYKKDK